MAGPERVMLVGSSGGHLAQLLGLRPWLRAGRQAHWVTFRTRDAVSRLTGEEVVWAYHPTTRNVFNLFRNLVLAWTDVRRNRPDLVVSTGAGLALPYFLIGRLCGARTVYIEVCDRSETRSLSGRLCRPLATAMCVQLPGQTRLYPGAYVIGELLGGPEDVDEPGPDDELPAGDGPLVVVSVGTDVHRFDRLIRWTESAAAELEATVPGARWVVQHGYSASSALEGADFLPHERLRRLFRAADVVVCHGGPGTIAEARAAGAVPLVVPRDPAFAEHVDDHQLRFTAGLEAEGAVRIVRTEREFVQQLTTALGEPVTVRPAPVRVQEPSGAGTAETFGRVIDGLFAVHPAPVPT